MPVRCSDPVAWAAVAIRRGCRGRGEDAVVVDQDEQRVGLGEFGTGIGILLFP